MVNEVLESIKELKKINVKKMKQNAFYLMKADSFDCYIEIHAGAGGTESQDWAEMLRKMYVKVVCNKRFQISFNK